MIKKIFLLLTIVNLVFAADGFSAQAKNLQDDKKGIAAKPKRAAKKGVKKADLPARRAAKARPAARQPYNGSYVKLNGTLLKLDDSLPSLKIRRSKHGAYIFTTDKYRKVVRKAKNLNVQYRISRDLLQPGMHGMIVGKEYCPNYNKAMRECMRLFQGVVKKAQ